MLEETICVIRGVFRSCCRALEPFSYAGTATASVCLREICTAVETNMVKPAFQNLPIECWIHPGRLGTAQPSVCLFHNSTLSGTELLDALDELKAEECPAQRTLTFASCSRESTVTKLKVIVVHEREDLKVMNVRCDADTAIIEATALGLSLLVSAITSWLAGAEDFGVSPCHSPLKAKEFGTLDRNSGELWFWGPGYAGP